MKTIITFGSSHLEWLHHKLNPMKVALIVEAESIGEARQIVMGSRISEFFATSYSYDKIEDFKSRLGMKEYTLKELEADTRENSIEAIDHQIIAITGALTAAKIVTLSKDGVFVRSEHLKPHEGVVCEDRLFLNKAILKMLMDGWTATSY